MDPISLAFYAVVCSLLSAAAPRLGTMTARLVTGAVVGIVAAAVLPTIRGLIGY